MDMALWQKFREEHGGRPGGRGFQQVWERRWELFQKEHGVPEDKIHRFPEW